MIHSPVPPWQPGTIRCQFCDHATEIDMLGQMGTCSLTNERVALDFHSCDKFQGNACDCHKCGEERGRGSSIYVLCWECGNKRCPKASDHNLECTGSNKSGQKGSIYEAFKEVTESD